MATKKQILALPVTGHPTITKVYVLQVVEIDPEVLLVHQEISEGEFELLKGRGHLKQFFPVDYSKIPKGALPIIDYYELI